MPGRHAKGYYNKQVYKLHRAAAEESLKPIGTHGKQRRPAHPHGPPDLKYKPHKDTLKIEQDYRIPANTIQKPSGEMSQHPKFQIENHMRVPLGKFKEKYASERFKQKYPPNPKSNLSSGKKSPFFSHGPAPAITKKRKRGGSTIGSGRQGKKKRIKT